MVTQAQIEGGWTELKGDAKQQWGELNDDELTQFQGTVEEFLGMIQRKTGEARAEVEGWFRQKQEQYEPLLEQGRAAARDYYQAATAAAGDTATEVRNQVHAGRVQAERMVRRHPAESVAVAFGVGIITGVVVGLLKRSR